MLQNEFDQELLADILVNAIYNIDNNNYDSNNDEEDIEGDAIDQLAKENIINLANQLLSKETLSHYPEFKIKKPNLFSKLNDTTTEAKNALEAKHNILHQICLNIIEEFPTLQLVKIESVEHSIIKIMYLQNEVENSTYIAINDEQQLKQNIQDFLNKIENKKG
jgi:hypothetical protein